jgi:ribosomal protein S18 acetylase RimI-like enzyme
MGRFRQVTRASIMDNRLPHLRISQQDQAAEVLSRAFIEDPFHLELLPDRDERMRAIQRLWRAVLRYSLAYGENITTPNTTGVACWLPPGNTRITYWRMLRTGFVIPRAVLKFGLRTGLRLLDAANTIDSAHHNLMVEPHWYLWVLAVDPECRGQGIGGKLLEPGLAQADQNGLPCYLETMNPKNVAFYEKRRFEVVKILDLLDQKVQSWMMVREPR